MGSILLNFNPKSDAAVLSGGDWRTTLPLANLTQPRLSRVARSTDTELTSTLFNVALPQEETFEVLILGPMNTTSGYQYRIRSWPDGTFTGTPDSDTDWIKPFEGSSGDPLELEWEDPNFWLGIIPFDDDERGVFLIHVFDAPVTGQFWSFELDDQFNPDGYIQISRLFMPETWAPSLNYGYNGNGLTFRDNTLAARTLSGSTARWRRLNPRVFRFAFDALPQDEGYADAYPFMRVAGYDGEVFVIPDPDDTAHIQKRSYLGTVTRMDGLSQAMYGLIGTGFEIEEII